MAFTLEQINKIAPAQGTNSIPAGGFNLNRVNQILQNPTQVQQPRPIAPVPVAPPNPIIDNPILKGIGVVADAVSNFAKNAPTAHFADKYDFFTPKGFVANLAQGLINTPSEALKGAQDLGSGIADGNLTLKRTAGDLAAAAQLPLLLLTGGGSSIAKEGLIQSAKNVATQGVKEAVKSVVKESAIGAGFGALSGVQSGKNIENNSDYLKNFLVNMGVGAAAGGGAAALSRVVTPLVKGASEKLGAVFFKDVHGSPAIDQINMAPEVAQHTVLVNNLEKEPAGKAILKESFVATKDNSHVSITPTEEGKYTLPGGQKIDVGTSPIYKPPENSATIEGNGTKKITGGAQTPQTGQDIQSSSTLAPKNGSTEAIQSKVPELQQNPLTPIGEGESKTSKLASGVQQKAVEKRLANSLGDLPEYHQLSMKDQAAKATDLLARDRTFAENIALGKEHPPEGILPESVFIAVENKALEEGNSDLLRRLATESSRSLEATAMGQRIRTLAERDPESAVAAMKQIADAREEAITRKNGGKVDDAIKKTADQIQKQVKKPDRFDWSKFLDTIEC